MRMEFAEITQDPWTNNTDKFFIVVGINSINIPSPSSPGHSGSANGFVVDPSGVTVDVFWNSFSQDYEVTGSLSDEAYAHSYSLIHRVVVPPSYKFMSFVRAIGYYVTLDELKGMIKV